MGWNMPNPVLIGSTYYLRVAVPKDVVIHAKGKSILVPVGDRLRQVKVGDAVKVSLGTRCAREAKRLFSAALVALEEQWELLRSDAPEKLTHKQCVALAGEVRSMFLRMVDEDPGDPLLWAEVAKADRAVGLPQPLDSLAIGTQEDLMRRRIEARFGGFADVALRRHRLVVDTSTRQRLIEQVAKAMEDVPLINLRKALGDYSDTGETKRFPEFQHPAQKTSPANPNPAGGTFDDVITEEVRRRSLGKDQTEIPPRTVSKFRRAAAEFCQHRQSGEVSDVTPKQIYGWKQAMLAEGKLSNNTIKQRLQNCRTVLEYARVHSFGELYPEGNPFDLVPAPSAPKADSSEKTLRLDEAKAILLATRKETKTERRWLPWLMAYSGARVEEVAQLKPTDVFQLEGLWFYRLTNKGKKTIKNTQSIRRVPIHPDVIAEGFLDFVDQHRVFPDFRLFPARSQANVHTWVREGVGIRRKGLAPNHGWRHLFQDRAMVAGMDFEVRSYIAGRTTGRSSEGYGKSDAMLPALAAQMKRLPGYL